MINTVNVIKTDSNGLVVYLNSWDDDAEGNAFAEEAFQVELQALDVPKAIIKTRMEEGYYTDGTFSSVQLVHSTQLRWIQ